MSRSWHLQPISSMTAATQKHLLGEQTTQMGASCVLSKYITTITFVHPTVDVCFQQSRYMSWGNEHKPNPRGKHRPNKHRDPLFRKMRAAKVVKINIPDSDFERKVACNKYTPEEMRAELKMKGLLPPNQSSEAPVYVASTGAIFDQYEPPESDGGGSNIGMRVTIPDAKKTMEKAKAKTFRATRKIRTYDDNFDARTFASGPARDIYINAHKALAAKQEKRLHQLVTERAFPEMMHNVERKSMYWEFIKSLQPPEVVQVRCNDIFSKGNIFAQVTVRFHTQQVI